MDLISDDHGERTSLDIIIYQILLVCHYNGGALPAHMDRVGSIMDAEKNNVGLRSGGVQLVVFPRYLGFFNSKSRLKHSFGGV